VLAGARSRLPQARSAKPGFLFSTSATDPKYAAAIMEHINTRSFGSFLLVGGSATLLQYFIMFMLMHFGHWSEGYASASGYVLSTFYNYGANARFTFQGKHDHLRSLPRFLATALAGLAINQFVLLSLTRLVALPVAPAQIVATGCVLVWNYLINAIWSFRSRRPS
jgi:putative flippase GtrA